MKRGQISVEYLIVVGFVVFLVLGILGIAFYYSSALRDSIKFYQLKGYTDKIITSANSVFFAGEPSKSTFTAYLPEGIMNITINEDNGAYSLVVRILSYNGESLTSYSSDVPLVIDVACPLTFSSGVKRISVEARSADVLIKEDSCS